MTEDSWCNLLTWHILLTENPFLVNMASSVVAGASGSIVTNPIWVIKTRLMSQSNPHGKIEGAMANGARAASTGGPGAGAYSDLWYTSTLDAARKMYRSEGILSFYSGLT